MLANMSDLKRSALRKTYRDSLLPNQPDEIMGLNARLLTELADNEFLVYITVNGQIPGAVMGPLQQIGDDSYQVKDVVFTSDAVLSITTSVNAAFVPINVQAVQFAEGD